MNPPPEAKIASSYFIDVRMLMLNGGTLVESYPRLMDW